jgi:HPt (histidine-containing phosphotransfer) domain-containing protein
MTDPRGRIAEDLGLELAQAEALLRTLVRATREDLQGLRRAVTARQAHTVASLAHHIKGAAANLEIEELRAPAERLEALGRQEQLTGADAELLNLERELEALEATLVEGAGGAPGTEQV